MPQKQQITLRNLPELNVPFFRPFMQGSQIVMNVTAYTPVKWQEDYYICLHLNQKGEVIMTPVNKDKKQRVAEFLASRTAVVISTLYSTNRQMKSSNAEFMRSNLFASNAVGSFKGLSAYNAKFKTSSQVGQQFVKSGATSSKMNAYKQVGRLKRTYQVLRDKNLENVKVAAKIEAGKVFITNVKKVLAPRMPFAVRGYLEHPLADVVIANALSAVSQQFSITNGEKFQWCVDAAMLASTTEAVASYDLPGLVQKYIDQITSGVTGLFDGSESVQVAEPASPAKAKLAKAKAKAN